MINKIFLTLTVFFLCLNSYAQSSLEEITANPEKAGGVYLTYPTQFDPLTKAPKGYKPFYVSHYGRHGSRYLISNDDYTRALNLFREAHEQKALTDLGEDVYKRLEKVFVEAEGHGGDLTTLGVHQHRGIAERMYQNFPEVFKNNAYISARSTVVLRCTMSMVAFCDRLKELNPSLHISYEASQKYMSYLNYQTPEANKFTDSRNGPWVEQFRKFQESMIHPDRLITTLFSNSDFVLKKVNPSTVMLDLYQITIGMQNIETKVSFYDLWLPQELFDLWQIGNFSFYVGTANHADSHGIVAANAKHLLQNIVESADRAIATGDEAATLRFGHDGNVINLCALMQIENFAAAVSDPRELYKVWANYKVAPMAANVQLVFFRNDKQPDDILVKVLHCENEVHIPVPTDSFPYYKWSDVRTYFQQLLDK
ncbi:MAG: histidine-type phosphatase [Bacteroidaceae bacterium]|nr:histidine-type phosphatase [Bacteroidaceae bacterium]